MSTKVYLAGPINGASDSEANDWRTEAKELLSRYGYGWLDPMSRDYRGSEDENVDQIVENDKADIDECEAVIAFCPKPSVGTSMEVFYAWSLDQPVIVVVPGGAPVSPWLRYHSKRVCPSVFGAVRVVDALLSGAVASA